MYFLKKITAFILVHLVNNNGGTYTKPVPFAALCPLATTSAAYNCAQELSNADARLCMDPLEKDATNPVLNTDLSSGVCWRVPAKC